MVYCILDYMEEPHEMVDHEVSSISYVLEETMDELDDIQAHVTFQRETDLSHEVIPLSMKGHKISLVLDHPLIELMHQNIWWILVSNSWFILPHPTHLRVSIG